MAHTVLIYIGSLISIVWGIGHLAATRPVVQGFGLISDDNRRIIAMEWILEGLSLCFLGVLPAVMVATGHSSSMAGEIVLWACAAMLLTMAIVSAATGARTSIAPMRACPYVKTTVAALLVVGSLVP